MLTLVILCAMAVAAVWAVRTPIFEEPDELAHADYAFALFDAGRPFKADRPPLLTMASKQATYLAGAVGYRAMRYNPWARVSSHYGTRSYYRALDSHAPARSLRPPPPDAGLPYVVAIYPAGYYALEAVAMVFAGSLTKGSLSAAFFAARFTNVLLLGVTLAAGYVVFRRSGLGRYAAVAAVAAVGFFPLESWVSGYIQPDNLVAALFAVTLAVSLHPRRHAGREDAPPYATFAVIGVLVALAVFTKAHYALALWLGVVPAAALRIRRARWFADSTALLAACVALPAIAYRFSITTLNPLGRLVSPSAWVATAGVPHLSLLGAASSLLRNGLRIFADAFFGGIAFQGFWYHFGVRGGAFFPGPTLVVASTLIVALTAVALAFFVFVELKLAVRLLRVARKRSALAALRLVLGATPVNAYCIVTAMLVGIGSITNGGLVLQGRYWLPVTLALGVVVFVQLPRFLRPGPRRKARFVLAAFAATYSIAAAPLGLAALQNNFYSAPAPGLRNDSVADVDRVIVADRTLANVDAVTMRWGQNLRLRGYAVDMVTGLPAQNVILSVDGRDRAIQRVVEPDQSVATIFDDDALLRSGFEFRLQPGTIGRGSHSIRCYVVDRKATYRFAFRRTIALRVI